MSPNGLLVLSSTSLTVHSRQCIAARRKHIRCMRLLVKYEDPGRGGGALHETLIAEAQDYMDERLEARGSCIFCKLARL